MNYHSIREKLLAAQPVLLDGGIGTEVMRRGIRWRQHGIEDAPTLFIIAEKMDTTPLKLEI